MRLTRRFDKGLSHCVVEEFAVRRLFDRGVEASRKIPSRHNEHRGVKRAAGDLFHLPTNRFVVNQLVGPTNSFFVRQRESRTSPASRGQKMRRNIRAGYPEPPYPPGKVR